MSRFTNDFIDEFDGYTLPSLYDSGPPDEGWLRPGDKKPDAWPGPIADRALLIDPEAWRAAHGACAADLARAAMAIGRLDAAVARMRTGAVTRLALIEVDALLWAAGTPVPVDALARDLIDARAGTNLMVLQQARWAVRRLEGHGDLRDLRAFLALHRSTETSPDPSKWTSLGLAPRLQGTDFDDAADELHQTLDALTDLHPIARGAFARQAWALSDLSRDEGKVEGAVWSAGIMAADCSALPFVPLGGAARRLLHQGGPPAERLRAHCLAVLEGASAAGTLLHRLQDWSERAETLTAHIKGDGPARIIAALLAHPQALTSTIEIAAGTSRDTAERLLARLAGMGLVRELTGARRFRMWSTAL